MNNFNKPVISANTSTKRFSVADEKLLSLSSNFTSLTSLDNELDYLNKADVTEGSINELLIYMKSRMQNDIENKKNMLALQAENLNESNKKNLDLHSNLSELNKQYSSLHSEFVKCNENKQKYNNDIIRIRRESTKEMDSKLNQLARQDKTIRMLKKELFLLINMLKLRIVNQDTIEEDQSIKGYLIDIESNLLKYIEILKGDEKVNKIKIFWASMKELLDQGGRKCEVNKENMNINSNA